MEFNYFNLISLIFSSFKYFLSFKIHTFHIVFTLHIPCPLIGQSKFFIRTKSYNQNFGKAQDVAQAQGPDQHSSLQDEFDAHSPPCSQN